MLRPVGWLKYYKLNKPGVSHGHSAEKERVASSQGQGVREMETGEARVACGCGKLVMA